MTDKLFAPWRMEYIKGVDEDSDECFLCAAAAAGDGTDEARHRLVVGRSELSVAVLNKFPYNNGHMLVAPAAHVSDLADLSDEALVDLMRLTVRMQATLQQVVSPHGFNMGLNIGRVAGAGLPGHLHFHVVPRWDGDTNFMPVLADVKVIPQHLDELYAKLTEDDA
jgi:ATP adenylyltransferase